MASALVFPHTTRCLIRAQRRTVRYGEKRSGALSKSASPAATAGWRMVLGTVHTDTLRQMCWGKDIDTKSGTP